MRTFEELQSEIYERGIRHNACIQGLRAVRVSTDKVELLKAILTYWTWCFEDEKIIDEGYILNNFTPEEIKETKFYLPSEKASYAEYVKILPTPEEGWELIKLNNGQIIKIARTNLKDAEYAISGGDEHFLQSNAREAAEKHKCRLFSEEEFVLFAEFMSVWDDEREGRWFRCATPEGQWVDIFFPASGYRGTGSGAFYYVGTNGFYWAAAVTGDNGYYLNFSSISVRPQNYTNRAFGFPVRCISLL